MIRVTIIKHSANMTLGFSLDKDPLKRIFVSRISPRGVLAGTAVREGMILSMVNGINCDGASLRFISSVLSEAEGRVELVVRDPSEDVTKQRGDSNRSLSDASDRSVIPTSVTPLNDDDDASTLYCVSKIKREHDKLGLRFHVSKSEKCIKIEKVEPDGIFGDTALRPGMILLRVNNIDIRDWPVKDVVDIIRFTDGELSLEAEKVGKNPNKYSVCMQKVNDLGKVVKSQVARVNSKQWGVLLRAGVVLALELNGIDSGFITEGLGN